MPRRQTRSPTHNHFVGYKTTPSENPPSFNGNPWNAATILCKMSPGANGSDTFKINQLRNVMKSQLGFTNLTDPTEPKSAMAFEIRFVSFSCWLIDSTVNFRTLSVYPFDIINSTTSETTEFIRLDSNSGRNVFARVGYTYPLSFQAVPIDTVRYSNFHILRAAFSSGVLEINFHILWRGSYTGELKLFYAPRDDSFSELDLDLDTRLDLLSRAVSTLTDKINDISGRSIGVPEDRVT